MKKLTIQKIESPEALKRLDWNNIDCANWSEFPDGPQTGFKVALIGEMLHILFHVKESCPRAECRKDFENVWEDSCVEFFCQVPGEERYRNFEFNSRGVCVATSRLGQNEGVIPFSEDRMKLIERHPSIEADCWELHVAMPLELVTGCPAPSSGAVELRGNFYKCGDFCSQVHFLSWAPISTPRPLFHCPEFFGNIIIL